MGKSIDQSKEDPRMNEIIGEIVNDTWLILEKIGEGTFSEIFVAKNIISKESDIEEFVVLKIQKKALDCSRQSVDKQLFAGVLKGEANLLQNLSNCQTSIAPKFYVYEKDDKFEYIAMEWLSGEDMSKLRDNIRSTIKAIPLPVVIHLVLQMLYCIERFHDQGVIHRSEL